MTTLIAHREFYSHNNCILYLKDSEGNLIKQFNNVVTQPKKGTKTILIKDKEFKIDWGNCKRNR